MVRIAQAYTKKPNNLKPLVSYIAERNENEMIDLLESKGIDTGKSTKDVIDSMMYYLGAEQKKGNFKVAIKDLYKLHPDTTALFQLFGKVENFEGNEPQKQNFFQTPLFRLVLVLFVIVTLIVIISKIGD